MFAYEKKLQYPVKIKNPNPKYAQIIISQYGGPDGELGAATRYLNQRYSMPDGRIIGTLTDIGSEELGHMEMVAAIIYQLTRNLSMKQIKEMGFGGYYLICFFKIFSSFIICSVKSIKGLVLTLLSRFIEIV